MKNEEFLKNFSFEIGDDSFTWLCITCLDVMEWRILDTYRYEIYSKSQFCKEFKTQIPHAPPPNADFNFLVAYSNIIYYEWSEYKMNQFLKEYIKRYPSHKGKG